MDSRRLGEEGSTCARAAKQGRIYRVYPVDKKPRAIPRLDKLDTSRARRRDSKARAAGSATPRSGSCCTGAIRKRARLLRKLVRETKHPKTRVQAIWTLADLDVLDETAGCWRASKIPIPGCAKA